MPWEAEADYFGKLDLQDSEWDFYRNDESNEGYVYLGSRLTQVHSSKPTPKQGRNLEQQRQQQQAGERKSVFQVDTGRLIKALNVEAKKGFINLIGKQYQFSDFLSIELNNVPDDMKLSFRVEWKRLALQFTTYSDFTLSERQNLIEEAKRFLCKIHFKKQIKLRQRGKKYDLDFRETNFDGFDFGEIVLIGCNFSKASLQYCKFIFADIKGADFSDADLTEANLCAANLSGANFSRVNLSEAKLVDANLSKAILREANLSGANLRNAILTNADFTDVIGKYLSLDSPQSNISDYWEHPRSFSRTGYYSGYDVRICDY
ncbi:pentapeptide repeat-containing protein [Rivularia sp. UHCC 0363]|uniref:pentapeptide repeat-containing protein n=1 Tax=Rivularia sp. UHCC 0363 TaxID=3110244 RepID=UPI002B21CF7C|nr:pentapeptide repeat-containing protein [Rivularia sp. UHCC 0363]MEA5592940.1 pentapeptide repeat-containing protein [Rivularia sp. UHCC 0363]